VWVYAFDAIAVHPEGGDTVVAATRFTPTWAMSTSPVWVPDGFERLIELPEPLPPVFDAARNAIVDRALRVATVRSTMLSLASRS
jgi:hypothetical protein